MLGSGTNLLERGLKLSDEVFIPFIRGMCHALGISHELVGKFGVAMFVAEHAKLHVLDKRLHSAFITVLPATKYLPYSTNLDQNLRGTRTQCTRRCKRRNRQ